MLRSWALHASESRCSFPKRSSLHSSSASSSDSPPSPSPARRKRGQLPMAHSTIKDSISYFKTEFSKELNTWPEQLHRDSESSNKKMGNQQGQELRPAWPSTEGRMGSLKPAQHTLMVGELEGPSPHHKRRWHRLATYQLSYHESLKAKSLDYSHSFSFVL